MPASPAAGHAEAHVQGDVSGQIAVGSYIYQIRDVHGGVINIQPPGERATLRARARPVRLQPRPFPGLLGREREVAAVRAAVGECAPLEIHGADGSGRTSLLRFLAHDLESSATRDGIAYVSARGERLDGVLQELVDAFFESDGLVRRLTPTELRHRLRELDAVVLVDDVELDRAALADLVGAAPRCALVVTGVERRAWGDVRSLALGGLDDVAALELWAREAGPPRDAEERLAVESICRAVGGLPLRVLQLASRAREAGETVSAMAARLGAAQAEVGAVNTAHETVEPLDARARRVLALLAAMRAPASAAQVALLADFDAADDASVVLDDLLRRKLVVREGERFMTAAPLPELAAHTESDEAEKRRAVVVLAGWGAVRSPRELAADAPLLERALDWALEIDAWPQATALARALDATLAHTGRWDAWGHLLDRVGAAAGSRGDTAVEAWTLHQQGTRALCLGTAEAAANPLTRALELRERLGDRDGAALTRHNMEVARIAVPGGAGHGGDSPWRERLPTLAAWGGAAAVGVIGFLLLRGVIGPSSGPTPPDTAAAVVPVAPPTPRDTTADQAAPRDTPVVPTAAGALAADVERIDFGALQVGDAGTTTVAIRNVGGAPIRVAGVQAPGNAAFTVDEGSCRGARLDAGAGCELVVRFRPADVGVTEGRVSVLRDDGEPLRIDLRGEGRAVPVGRLAADAPSVNFGSIPAGTATGSRIRLHSLGTAPVTVSGIDIDGSPSFRIRDASGCDGARLDPGGECILAVDFAPAEPGDATARISIAAAGLSAPIVVALLGSATPPPVGRLEPRPGALRFGEQQLRDEAGAPATVELANVGTGPIRPLDVAIRGAIRDFRILEQDCQGRVLDPGAACRVVVGFAALAEGPRAAELAFRTDVESELHVIPLEGVGTAPPRALLEVDPESVEFGERPVPEGLLQEVLGAVLAGAESVRVTSRGNVPVALRRIAIEGRHPDDFSVATGACREGTSLASDAACDLRVSFRPREAGPRVARLVIEHGGEDGQAVVALAGIGIRADTADRPDRPDPTPPRPSPPDLVVTLEATGTARPDDRGFLIPVRIQVTNRGREAAGSFKVAIETPDGVVPFDVSGQATMYAEVKALGGGQSLTRDGLVLVRTGEGATVVLSAFVDSCSGVEFAPAHCAVEESDERNNQSRPVRVTIPVMEGEER